MYFTEVNQHLPTDLFEAVRILPLHVSGYDWRFSILAYSGINNIQISTRFLRNCSTQQPTIINVDRRVNRFQQRFLRDRYSLSHSNLAIQR